MNKKNIPTHDPQTGELNPYYEDLTGEPNPLVLHQLDAEQQKTYLEFYNEEYVEKRKAYETWSRVQEYFDKKKKDV